MRRLFGNLLTNAFKVEARPVPIYRGHEDEHTYDLVQSISSVMLDNERLADMAEELRSLSSSPEEMEKFMKSLLPTLDSFDRILSLARGYEKSEEIDNWLKSIESIHYRLLVMLEGYGLYQLKTTGTLVDLDMHEVVEYRASEGHPNDVVISERQKGYVFRNKLLRDAKVVVAYNERLKG